ncbi:MAG: hypothetical protein NTZ59_02455 [Bacteroidetes bacterium]|nr:hypothetical protein [Bacteroidota bacterium]
MKKTIVLNNIEGLIENVAQPTVIATEVELPPAPLEEPVKEVAPAEPTTPQQPTTTAIPKQPMSEEQLEFVADIIVTTFDTVQEFGFTYLSNRKLKTKSREIYGDGAMQKLHLMLREQEAAHKNKATETPTYTSEESAILELYDNVKTFQKDLAFDNRSSENIKFALKQIMREKQQQLSPQMLLMLSLLGALTPNFAALKTL